MKPWQSILVALLAHGLFFLVPSPGQQEEMQQLEEIRFVLLPAAPEDSAPEPQPEPQPPKPEPRPKPKPEPVAKPVSLPMLPLLDADPVPTTPAETKEPVVLTPPMVSPAAPVGPVRTSFDAPEGPRFRDRVVPEYPMRARRMNREGVVSLELHIDARGELLEATLLEGAGFGMDEAALRAVRQSTYVPARQEGRPVASRAVLNVRFQLRE